MTHANASSGRHSASKRAATTAYCAATALASSRSVAYLCLRSATNSVVAQKLRTSTWDSFVVPSGASGPIVAPVRSRHHRVDAIDATA